MLISTTAIFTFWLFVAMAAMATVMLVVAVQRDGPPEWEISWGEPGPGIGNVALSPALVYLLLALTFGGSAIYIVLPSSDLSPVTMADKSGRAN